jgi:peptidoglycan/xylan/chitin deacetylase (PgdA/CDA1 family)
MQRRAFIRTTISGTFAMGLCGFTGKGTSHILTLSFDDGFRKSFYGIADIHEEFGLQACLNVIASAHLPAFKPPNVYQEAPVGDFDDWNRLQERGHEIMPHSWDHANLTQMPLDQAREDIDKCLLYFQEHLEGFDASEAIYNFAYNASTPEIEQYALTRVRAIRTHGDRAMNPVPTPTNEVRRLSCWSYGPENADEWVELQVNEFLNTSGGWLILNLHGLDDEGWGPVSTTYLHALLKRLVRIESLEVLPAGKVLASSS